MFTNCWFDTKFHELPVMFYYAGDKELDLSGSCVNIVPAGLKGVDKIKLREQPIAVAPDFKGKITYERGAFCFQSLADDIKKVAKAVYVKNKEKCETPHILHGGELYGCYCNLPANMHFITVGNQTFLDLRQCNVELKRSDLYFSGIKAVLLPTDREGKASRLLRKMQLADRQRQ